MENSLDREKLEGGGGGGGRLPRMQTDYQSLGSAKPRAPVNTEIMQRDNSPLPHPLISSDNAPQDLHEVRREGGTRRRVERQKGDDDDDVQVDGEERRTNGNGRDLGTRRERESSWREKETMCTPRRRWCILLIIMIIPRSRL